MVNNLRQLKYYCSFFLSSTATYGFLMPFALWIAAYTNWSGTALTVLGGLFMFTSHVLYNFLTNRSARKEYEDLNSDASANDLFAPRSSVVLYLERCFGRNQGLAG